jgi:hypothetical protein
MRDYSPAQPYSPLRARDRLRAPTHRRARARLYLAPIADAASCSHAHPNNHSITQSHNHSISHTLTNFVASESQP